jgi:hypothetical protein
MVIHSETGGERWTTPIGTRSLWTTLAATVWSGLAASLIGCAAPARSTPSWFSDVKSVAGRGRA